MSEWTNKTTRLILWMILLLGTLIVQHFLGSKIGPFVTSTMLVTGVSLVYGFILVSNSSAGCKYSSASDAQETTSDSSGLSKQHIIGDDGGETSEETIVHSLNNTNQASEDWEPDGLETNLMNDSLEQETPARKRLYFLDNIKSFLTFLVVSHHITCSFGGCGPGSWFLIVGLHDNWFQPFGSVFALMNQGYFMSLFFFISAYFVPSSLERHGRKRFLFEKAKRLWIPAFFITLVMFPLVLSYCLWFVGKDPSYLATPGHTWFLFWLLIFHLAYVHIYGETNADEPCEWALPGLWKRYFFYGPVVCGLGMTIVFIILEGHPSFASMPLAPGSLVSDLLFYSAGTVAKRNGWLESDYLSMNIGLSDIALTIMVVLESVVFCYSFSQGKTTPSYYLIGLIAAGIYCIDMSLAVLRFFQAYLDFQTKRSKFLSDAAYTVYLIHPCVIVLVSSLWICLYESQGYKLEWSGVYSKTPIEGGGLTLALSWLCSNLLTHLVVWPLAWYLRKLPGLRQIL